MSNYLLRYKRMKIKKVDAIKESKALDNWVSEIIEYAERGFEAFLENIEASKKIEILSKNIEWEIILSLFNIRFYQLIKEFELPKHSDLHFKNLSGFRHAMFESIKIEMYYYIFVWIKQYSSKKSNEIFDLFLTKMNSFIHPFDFQYSMTSIRDKDQPNVLIRDIMEIQHKVEVGAKFDHGKKNRPDEIEAFKIINSKYNELNGTPYSKDLKQICREVAYERYNYKDEDIEIKGEKVNLFGRFYDRLLYYNKPK